MPAPDGQPLLRLDRLSKRFGDRLAVEALSLVVAPGEIYGLIGPNGSGKTTTVKLITGLYLPTAGQILIGGIDLRAEPERAKRLIGYIPDEPFVYEKMTGREFLQLVGALYRDFPLAHDITFTLFTLSRRRGRKPQLVSSFDLHQRNIHRARRFLRDL